MKPQGIAIRTTVRCVACKEQGKTRDFRTASGFLSHLKRYHGAISTDFVTKMATACPFCGGRRLADETSEAYETDPFIVRCQDCGAHGPVGDTATLAQKAWNRRASG